MQKKVLTDRFLKSLKPAPKGKRYDVWDSVAPGLGMQVTATGAKTFKLMARYPGGKGDTALGLLGKYHPFEGDQERRAEERYAALPEKERGDRSFEAYLLDTYGATTLAAAREKARRWQVLIGRGIDPRREEERAQAVAEAAEIKKQKNTFAAAAEDFIARKLSKERKGRELERDIRRDLIPKWGNRAINEITEDDVVEIIEAKETRPAQARNLFGTTQRLFKWAKARKKKYGLLSNPCAEIELKELIGTKKRRIRTLNDGELRALWRATRRMGYPSGAVYRVLLLSGLRLNEAADAAWTEFDFREGLWVIPAPRMKGKNDEALPHAVPLTGKLLDTIRALPRWNGGDFLFSATGGSSPVWISNKIKKRLDARMLRTLQALARSRGDDAKKVRLDPWVNHDIRRTVRTRLSRLKIEEEVREAVLAHVRPGIKANYDLHDYREQKTEALTLWAEALMKIVEPPPEPPSNVVELTQARA